MRKEGSQSCPLVWQTLNCVFKRIGDEQYLQRKKERETSYRAETPIPAFLSHLLRRRSGRVLEHLLGEIGLRRGQHPCEISLCLALALVEPGVDLVSQDCPTPAVLVGHLGVPVALRRVRDGVEQPHDVPPGQSGSSLLPKLRLGICGRKGTHVAEIAGRETRHVEERAAQVGGEARDHSCSPSVGLLTLANRAPDVPIQGDQLAVDRERSSHLRRVDALFQVAENSVVVRGQGEGAQTPALEGLLLLICPLIIHGV